MHKNPTINIDVLEFLFGTFVGDSFWRSMVTVYIYIYKDIDATKATAITHQESKVHKLLQEASHQKFHEPFRKKITSRHTPEVYGIYLPSLPLKTNM